MSKEYKTSKEGLQAKRQNMKKALSSLSLEDRQKNAENTNRKREEKKRKDYVLFSKEYRKDFSIRICELIGKDVNTWKTDKTKIIVSAAKMYQACQISDKTFDSRLKAGLLSDSNIKAIKELLKVP